MRRLFLTLGKLARKLSPARPVLATARIETTTVGLINFTGMLLEGYTGRNIHGIPDWPLYYSAAIGLVVSLVVLRLKHEGQRPMISMLFLINAIAISTALYIRHPYYASDAPSWIPFEANKFGCLIVALMAPGLWVGILAIAAHSLTSVIQFELFSEVVQSKLPVSEPTATLAFAVASILILISKFQRIYAESEYRRIQAETAATQRLIQTMMRLKSLMNTPIQSIRLSTAIQREQEVRDDAALNGLEAAVEDLSELNSMLDKV